MTKEEQLALFNKYINNYKFVAHRLGFQMNGYPENDFNNLISLFKDQERLDQVDGLEFDIQFTADHVPIVIHDACTADTSDVSLAIGKTNYSQLRNVLFSSRKSEGTNNSISDKTYYVSTLEEFLEFFYEHQRQLNDKLIKIESKSIILNKEDMIVLSELLEKFKALQENIIHLSFFPWNLASLRGFQKDQGLAVSRTEALVDFDWEKYLRPLWNHAIDGMSLGIKSLSLDEGIILDADAKKIADLTAFFVSRRNAVSENLLRQLIKRHGYAGIYTINDQDNIIEFMNRVSKGFLDEYSDKLIITSDNPVLLRKIK